MEFDINFIEASKILGVFDEKKIVDMAISALRSPVDEILLRISLCEKSDSRCIQEGLLALKERDGVHQFTKLEAMAYYVNSVCRDILNGTLFYVEGLRLIFMMHLSNTMKNFHDLDEFIYIYGEIMGGQSELEGIHGLTLASCKRYMQAHRAELQKFV